MVSTSNARFDAAALTKRMLTKRMLVLFPILNDRRPLSITTIDFCLCAYT
jgi:hypothetical protein